MLRMKRQSPVPHITVLQRRVTAWKVASIAAFIVMASGAFVPESWRGIPALCAFLFLGSAFALVKADIRVRLALRRHDVRPITPSAAIQDRAPVLYLRSFDDDASGARVKGMRTEEEHLAAVLAPIGPFVAVGRPHEVTPELGASRMYLQDTVWQDTVESLMRRAALVVLRTGTTVGILWELQQALRVLRPERFILLADNRRELSGCLEQIQRIHPQRTRRVRTAWRPIGSVRAIIAFDDQWQAFPLRFRAGILHHARDQTLLGVRLLRTLAPVFKRLDVESPAPKPNHWTRMMTIGLGFVSAIWLSQPFGAGGLAAVILGAASFVGHELFRSLGWIRWLQWWGVGAIFALLAPALLAAAIIQLGRDSLPTEVIATIGIVAVSLGGAVIPSAMRLLRAHGWSSTTGLTVAASLLCWVLAAWTVSETLSELIALSDAAFRARRK